MLLLLFAFPASANEQAAFHGVWGTEAQCGRELIKPGGTVVASPYEVGPEWLRQGGLWCRLNWYPVEPRDGGAFSGALAQCGEDAVRDYRVRMVLRGDELTLHWGLFQASGPLRRCPSS
ncbi:MAG: hypothetical protein AAF401_18025 [Pseudomonadota bacterium]